MKKTAANLFPMPKESNRFRIEYLKVGIFDNALNYFLCIAHKYIA
jgi:hypothetical protein